MRLSSSIVVLCVAMAGCSPVPVPVPSGAGQESPSTPVPRGDAAMASAIVDLTNRERGNARLAPLARDERLMRAAQIHAGQMAAMRRMEHVLSGAAYPSPEDRLTAVGYSFSATAENISWNQPDAGAAVAGWMRSSGHRTNILNGTYTQMGAGFARNASGQGYYVQVFGRPR